MWIFFQIAERVLNLEFKMVNKKNYHSVSIEEVFQKFKTKTLGLSKIEAALRLNKFVPNSLPQAKRLSVIRLFSSPV